jgi:ParB-like chromosome segregation protein Spo0J
MDPLEFHPLANIFPLMTDDEIEVLGEDMLKHGQLKRIMRYEGKILDGRNRYRACLLKGIEPRLVDYHGPDPLGLVISLNLKRRHLDDGQRAMIAASLATMKQGARTDLSPNCGMSQSKAAELLNVNKRRVERAREVVDHGVPDLVDAVKRGDVKVSAAAEFAKETPPLEQQRQIVEHGTPAAAVKATVKAKADRAAHKTPKPKPDVAPAADRAERTPAAKAAASSLIAPKFISEFTRTDGQVKAACDYNPEDPGDVAESDNDTPEMIRHRIFMYRATEAARHAREFGLEKASSEEFTDDVIEAALNAAEAWSDLTSALQERRSA